MQQLHMKSDNQAVVYQPRLAAVGGHQDAAALGNAAAGHKSLCVDALYVVDPEPRPFKRLCRGRDCLYATFHDRPQRRGDRNRLGALVVPSAEGRAALAGGTYSAAASRLRRDLLAEVGELAFPRRIRFVRELPVNEQGKTTVAAVRLALSAWCQEPVVLEWSATDAALSAKLVFPPDAICFSGHFPGFPVRPGVAQLFVLRHFARQVFADFPDAADWRRLKFQKIATPGKVLELSVVRKGEGSFDFSFRVDTGQCSSGAVEGVAQ